MPRHVTVEIDDDLQISIDRYTAVKEHVEFASMTARDREELRSYAAEIVGAILRQGFLAPGHTERMVEIDRKRRRQ
jgi:hypothetical protein